MSFVDPYFDESIGDLRNLVGAKSAEELKRRVPNGCVCKEEMGGIASPSEKQRSCRPRRVFFREVYNYYRFKRSLYHVQSQGVLIAERLGLETDDDVYQYLADC